MAIRMPGPTWEMFRHRSILLGSTAETSANRGFVSGKYYNFICWVNRVFFGSTPACPVEPASTFHFIVPKQVPGNVGRNSLFEPGQIYFDTAIQRDFPIYFWKLENQMLEFRAEMFKAFNHPNLYTPSYTMMDINFNNTAIAIDGGRQIKFWLKCSFEAGYLTGDSNFLQPLRTEIGARGIL